MGSRGKRGAPDVGHHVGTRENQKWLDEHYGTLTARFIGLRPPRAFNDDDDDDVDDNDPVVAVVLATFPRQKRPAMPHRRLPRRSTPNSTISERPETDLGYRINVIAINH